MEQKSNKTIKKATARSKFDKYCDYFVVEGMSLKDIAEHFGLNYISLRKRAMQGKWSEAKKKEATKRQQKEIQKEQIQNQVELEKTAQKALSRVEYLKKKDDVRLSRYEFYQTVVHTEIKKMVVASQEKGEPLNAKVMELYVKCIKELTILERLVDNQPTSIEKNTVYIAPDPEAAALEQKELEIIKQRKEIERLKGIIHKDKKYDNPNTGGN